MKNNKTIVLIQGINGFWDEKREGKYPPLGLLSTATFVSKKYNVELFDIRFKRKWKKELIRVLDENQVILIAFSVFTGPIIKSNLEICEFIKSNYQIPIVFGGVHASLYPRQTLENKFIDYVVFGEGEYTFFELVNYLDNNQYIDISCIKGLGYKINSTIILNSARQLLQIEHLPEIPYDIVDITKYNLIVNEVSYFSIQTSRGCPYSCNYCYNNNFNEGKYRFQSANKVIKRIEAIIKKYSISAIHFLDDNFFIDKYRTIEIAKYLFRKRIKWSANTDVYTIKQYKKADFDFFKQAGLIRIANVGVESGSIAIRKRLNKLGSYQDVVDLVHKIQGIPIQGTFMINFPFEKKEDFLETIGLINNLLKINKNFIVIGFLKFLPFPGTVLFDQLVEKQLYLPPRSLEDWGKVSWESEDTPIFSELFYNSHIIKAVQFLSLFIDNKIWFFSRNPVLILLTILYRPIARFRLRKFNFRFMPELYLFEKIYKIF